MSFLKLISQAFPRPLPQSTLVFPALSLALFFARAPLSERLEQAILKLINYARGNKRNAWPDLGHMDAPLYPGKEQMKSSVYWISKHT